MIKLKTNEIYVRKAKLGELKTGESFAEDYNRDVVFHRSEDPIPGTGGGAYTLYVCNRRGDILYETFLLKWDI